MLLYTTVGAHDLKASYKFYDAVLKPLGYERLKEFATEIGYTPKQLQSLNGPPTARPTGGTSMPKINDTAAQRDGGAEMPLRMMPAISPTNFAPREKP